MINKEAKIRRLEKYHDKKILAYEKLHRFSQEMRMAYDYDIDDNGKVHTCSANLLNHEKYLNWNDRIVVLICENKIWFSKSTQIILDDLLNYWLFIRTFLEKNGKVDYYPVIGEFLFGDFIEFGNSLFNASIDFTNEEFNKPIELYRPNKDHSWKKQDYSKFLINIVGDNLEDEFLVKKIENHPYYKKMSEMKNKKVKIS
ncbi:MAG: hypothetical protein GYA51_13765 [Candidatus Methanofastidiosa archaeon]|nr:hypothetical protein [Candidatus Methanofastidiosa archaeon]